MSLESRHSSCSLSYELGWGLAARKAHLGVLPGEWHAIYEKLGMLTLVAQVGMCHELVNHQVHLT